MKHTYVTLSDRVDSRIYPRVSAFFARNNTLSRFSFGDTIPDPFPVGDYPSRPGTLDDVEQENRELKERLRRLRLEEENKRLRREIERLERGAPSTDFKL
jgi:hypothetical protein